MQRDKFDFIPNALYELLLKFILKGKSIADIKHFFEDKNDSVIDEYFEFLEQKEYGFYSDAFLKMPRLKMDEYIEPKEITNAIIDFSSTSAHHDISFFTNIIMQLSNLQCEAVELRFYHFISIENLIKKLDCFEHSPIRDIEVLMNYNEIMNLEKIVEIRLQQPRLRKIIFYNSLYNKILEHEEIVIIYTKENIDSEKHCGIISPWYFVSKIETFCESKNYNSCLNRKISIDKDGNIKNCPSMSKSYGNISKTYLHSVLNELDFKKIWKIKKDEIDVCKECEFRYICIDCWAYLTERKNIYSKPLKCKYNPYE